MKHFGVLDCLANLCYAMGGGLLLFFSSLLSWNIDEFLIV